MALPSAVTLGSLALVTAAAAGLGVVATSSAHDDKTASLTPPTSTSPTHQTPTPDEHTGGKPHRHAPDPVPNTLVDVYNNSGVAGLAADKASFLQGAGWNVAGTDNWYGDIPADTVYYPPRLHDDAAALAKALHISRLHEAVAPMSFDRLTVILTSAS